MYIKLVVENIYSLQIIYLSKVVSFLFIMEMATVMMKTTMKPACLMEEIAVDLMLIQIIAQYVNALKEEEGVVVEELQHLPELQLAEIAIRVGLEMGIVMISTTI